MDFSPRPAFAFGWLAAVLPIFGTLILILFVRSLLVGDPGLQAADVFVALGAAVTIPIIALLMSWFAIRRFRRMGNFAAAAGEPTHPASGSMFRFDTFDAGARRVLTLAQDEAMRLGHHYIGTEHLLLALTRDGDSVAGRTLAILGVDLVQVRTAVEFIVGHGRERTSGEVGLTPRAKRVIELAIDEAKNEMHADHIGTQHLLLGLIREGDGIAAAVLQSLGVTLQKAREAILRNDS